MSATGEVAAGDVAVGSELLPAWAAARDVIGRVGCAAVAEWRTLVCPSFEHPESENSELSSLAYDGR